MRWSAVLGAVVGRRRAFDVTGPVAPEVAAARLARRGTTRALLVAPSPAVPGPLLVRLPGAPSYAMSFEGRLDVVDGGTRLRGDIGRPPQGRVHRAIFVAVAALLLVVGVVGLAVDGSIVAFVGGLVAVVFVSISARIDARAATRLEAALAAAVAPDRVSALPET